MRWAIAVLLALGSLVSAEDWPRFRGPQGSGVSDSTGLPTVFGPKSNLAWRVQVPTGRSSPIVVGGRVYLTALEGDRLVTLALDRATGASVWRREIPRPHAPKIYVGNDTATPTPASDGQSLYVFFPDLGLVSFDAAGGERWRLPLGPFHSFYGLSASPVVHGDTVLLVCDQPKGSFALGVDKDTGRVRWRAERAQAREGFSTPTVYAPKQEPPQLIATGAYRVDAYDVETGRNVWWAGRQAVFPISSPVLAGDTLIAVSIGGETPEFPPFDAMLKKLDTNGDSRLTEEEWNRDADYNDHFGWADADGDGFLLRAEWDDKLKESVAPEHGVVGVAIGGAGDQTGAIRWRYKKSYSGLTTPLVYRGVLYLVKEGGIVTTLDPATGAVLKTGRAEGAIDPYYASPVAADGKVFLASHSGKVAVLRAGPQWELLAVNDLDETTLATPAIADGRLYVRTEKALYCFGAAR